VQDFALRSFGYSFGHILHNFVALWPFLRQKYQNWW